MAPENPDLMSLPLELKREIIFHLDLSSLKNIRLVHKSLNEASSFKFCRYMVHLRSVAVSYTLPSIHRLVDISNHSHYSTHVRSLRVEMDGLLRPDGPISHAILSGAFTMLLAHALGNLTECTRIQVACDPNSYRHYTGPREDLLVHASTLLSAVVGAVIISRTPLKVLKCGSLFNDLAFPTSLLGSFIAFPGFSAAATHLTDLELKMSILEQAEFRDTKANVLADFLALIPSLEDLSIDLAGDSKDHNTSLDLLQSVFANTTLPSLQTLAIHTPFRPAQLRVFLFRHRETVRNLHVYPRSMQDCCANTLKPLLRSICDDLSLRNLCFSINSQCYCNGTAHSGKVEFRFNVQTRLQVKRKIASQIREDLGHH
ncbi:hypothetical protein EJ08DRAFT_346925 [Tothia fuscella]|uniref:F-box domain-containing protein n=1 Tax=Tothia fuscella TaxID=1048955 RepID=A0A9P4NMV4_9PEZI|nr:hypothetical protein EJ08DRAFT_346925 [Tothia fuscella]